MAVWTVSHMIRDVAAQRIGPITKTGLRTYVDPREQGGKFHADQVSGFAGSQNQASCIS